VSDRSTEHATFAIEREYPAAPARVWRAWADAEEKRRWFGPPEKHEHEHEHELDFRVGGRERLVVRAADGARYTFESRFQDIVEGQRIVHTYEMHRDQTRISVSVATIELVPAGAGTRLTLTEQGVFLDGHDTNAAREHGTRELLDALATALAAAAQAP